MLFDDAADGRRRHCDVPCSRAEAPEVAPPGDIKAQSELSHQITRSGGARTHRLQAGSPAKLL